MLHVEKSVVVQRPIEEVFTFIDIPVNLIDIWPNMVEIKDVQPAAGGGHNFRWVYKMAGFSLEGTSTVTEYVPNQRIVNKNTGPMESVVTFLFAPEGTGTRVTFQSDYDIPGNVLGMLAKPLISMQNERDIDALLSNLKKHLDR
ncbi:MAG: hypothetical protein HC893_08135 [Chloroflexaceae bacterium]|nr:hypothetical protein [Chloroflexaceae bacterium]NJL33822.1 hypothetical protein [Chloroflexaceae bacterium]NJO07789.1 hypothetical protein [Chloroflexaceae bacterium]